MPFIMPRLKSVFFNLFLFICSASLLLTGCAFLGSGMEEPTVSLSDLKLQEIKALETIFMVELRVMNPNKETLEIRGLNCKLKIDGELFATGISDASQDIPAFGTGTVPVMVYASMFDMVSTVIQLLQEEDKGHGGSGVPLDYELAGNILLGKGWKNAIPFQAAGKLALD